MRKIVRERMEQLFKKLIIVPFGDGPGRWIANCCGSHSYVCVSPKGIGIGLNTTPIKELSTDHIPNNYTTGYCATKNASFKLEDNLFLNYRYQSITDLSLREDANIHSEGRWGTLFSHDAPKDKVVSVCIEHLKIYLENMYGLHYLNYGDTYLKLEPGELEEIYKELEKALEGKYVLFITRDYPNINPEYVISQQFSDKIMARWEDRVIHKSPKFCNTNYNRPTNDLQLFVMKF